MGGGGGGGGGGRQDPISDNENSFNVVMERRVLLPNENKATMTSGKSLSITAMSWLSFPYLAMNEKKMHRMKRKLKFLRYCFIYHLWNIDTSLFLDEKWHLLRIIISFFFIFWALMSLNFVPTNVTKLSKRIY